MGNLEGVYQPGTEGVVPVIFRTGPAGCGKTYSVRAEIEKDPKYALLSATTGIAAINLGTITLNSLLRYYDTKSLEEAFFNGWLQKTILKLMEDGYKWLAIDECSMLDGLQLDILYQCVKMCNEVLSMSGKPPLGILLVGDFCQLSPVKAKWCFQADCWPMFKASTERMTKIWRQTDVSFLEAVNHIRAGRGMIGATLLSQMGVEFVKHAETSFPGTTIIAKNEAVDNFNWLCHSKLPGIPKTVTSDRWVTSGRQPPTEWKNIPQSIMLKPNAYVMILTNDNPDFTFVNGDCGNIVDFEDEAFSVRLARNGETVKIGRITRKLTQKEPPDELLIKHPGVAEDELKKLDREVGMPYWDVDSGRNGMWVTGAITFYPLRLAYASTTHKCQGLTLDKIQIDLNQNFMTYPGMTYTALSRVRTPQGLRIVGSPALLGSRTHTDPLVLEWL